MSFLYRSGLSLRILVYLMLSIELLRTCESSALKTRHHQRGPDLRDDSPWKNATVPISETTTPSTTSQTLFEYRVLFRKEAIMACDLVVKPIPGNDGAPGSAVWLHDGQAVEVVRVDIVSSDSVGHRYSQERESGKLHISNVRLEDEGIWQCVSRDPVTQFSVAASRPIHLVVLDMPRSVYLLVDGRRLDPGNLFLPVSEGAGLSVGCIAEGGHPSPGISWTLALADPNSTTGELNGTLSGSETTTAHHHTRSEAGIPRVLRAHHNATVTCAVNHAALTAPLNASLLLDVQYSPSFAISRIPGFGIPVREGIPVSLKCDVDSNPSSNPVWVKDDGVPPVAQSGDGFLNFSAIRREHSGWYKCTCRHLLGEFSSIGYFLNVRYDPNFSATTGPGTAEWKQVEVALGGAVQLQCPSGDNSCWTRVGLDGRVQPVGPGPELAMDQVIYQEAGEYHCAVGSRPALNHRVNIVVRGLPMVYPFNKSITAITGKQVSLAVEFCANPAVNRAIWLAGKQQIRPGETTEKYIAHNLTAGTSTFCYNAMLTIPSLLPSDEGEYIFLVRSPRGLAEGVITVNVTRASSFSIPAARANHLTENTALCLIVTLLAVWRYCSTELIINSSL